MGKLLFLSFTFWADCCQEWLDDNLVSLKVCFTQVDSMKDGQLSLWLADISENGMMLYPKDK